MAQGVPVSWLDDLPKCRRSGKFRHPDEASALAQLAMLKARKPVGPRMHPYRCPFCHDWHIGHDGRQLTKDIRRALRAGKRAAQAQTRTRRR